MRIPVTFTSTAGNRLVGMIHLPEERERAEWPALAICLCTAINPRYAGRDFKRELISGLNSEGIPLFSFDFAGVGDSEGELRENSLIDIYHHIETGDFVQDTLDAVRFARERFPSRKIILIGRCGGAITALHAAARDADITHLVLFELPVSLSTPPDVVALDRATARYRLGAYMEKLRNLRKLPHNLLCGANWRNIWSALACLRKSGRHAHGLVNGLNASFLSSFFEVKRLGTGVLCIFGGDGTIHQFYDALFRARYAVHGGEPAKHWATRTSQTGGHDFSTPESRREAMAFLESELREWGVIADEPDPAALHAILP